MERKIKIAIMSDPMDRRPERAFAPKRLTENLLKNPEFEVTLIHFKKMDDEPLYKRAREIRIPLLKLPWASHFFSYIWFCFTTKEKFDIVYWLIPRVYPFFFFFPAKTTVVMAHDGYIGLWTFPNTMSWFFLRFFNRFVGGIIGVSEFAKREIMETYHFPESRVFVAYNGVDSVYQPMLLEKALPILKKYNINEGGYFLYVGGMQPHKNVKRLIEAYILLRDNTQTNRKLVLVGKTSFGEKVLDLIKDSKYTEDIILAGFVPIEDLPAFYSSSVSLVFVSLHEGCGMPLIESMACGSPVVISNISSMPEIGDGAAVLVNPYDPVDIMKGMKKIMEDELLRKSLIEKGYKHASQFTWERYAKEVTNVYKNILRNYGNAIS